MIPKKDLVILAVIESTVMFSAIIRLTLGGSGFDLSRQPQLIWFVGVMVLSAAGLAHYVVRASALQPRIKAGENVEDDRKQLFTISIAVLAAAALLSLAGPQALERLLG